VNKRSKRVDQRRPGRLQFSQHMPGEVAQNLFTLRSKRDKNSPLVSLIAMALNKVVLHEPVDQLDSTVMLELEALGQLADRRFPSLWQPLYREQQLVLLRREPRFSSSLLAKTQKATHAVAKFGQCSIIRH
jgi:hypothetical protein